MKYRALKSTTLHRIYLKIKDCDEGQRLFSKTVTDLVRTGHTVGWDVPIAWSKSLEAIIKDEYILRWLEAQGYIKTGHNWSGLTIKDNENGTYSLMLKGRYLLAFTESGEIKRSKSAYISGAPGHYDNEGRIIIE